MDVHAYEQLMKAKREVERTEPLKYAFRTPDGQLLDEKAEEPEEGDVTPLTIIVPLTKAEANEFLAQSKYALANTLADVSEDRRRIARRILKSRGQPSVLPSGEL